MEQIVNQMLQVSPFLRPTCDKLLQNEFVKEWSHKVLSNFNLEDLDENYLLKTIKPSNNLFSITNQLPKPNYDKEEKKINKTSLDMQSHSFPKLNKDKKIFNYYHLKQNMKNIEEENENVEIKSPEIPKDIKISKKILKLKKENEEEENIIKREKIVEYNYYKPPYYYKNLNNLNEGKTHKGNKEDSFVSVRNEEKEQSDEIEGEEKGKEKNVLEKNRNNKKEIQSNRENRNYNEINELIEKYLLLQKKEDKKNSIDRIPKESVEEKKQDLVLKICGNKISQDSQIKQHRK